MSIRQFEWIVRERLTGGLQAIRNDLTLLDAMFIDLSANSLANLKTWIQSHDIDIRLSYPIDQADVPCWTIAMVGDSTARTPIGSLVQQLPGEEAEYGDIVQKTYQILTISQNPDLTLILSAILQHILKSMRIPLEYDGFHSVTVAQNDAMDIRPDFLPLRLYARTTTIGFMVEDTYIHVPCATLPTSIEMGPLCVEINFGA